MNKSLIETIKDEIRICDSEIEGAGIEMRRLQERRLNYDDRRTMLRELLEKAEADAKEREQNESNPL